MSTSSTFNNVSPIFTVDNSLSNLVDDLNLNYKQDDPFCFSTYYHFPSPMSTYYNEFDGFDDLLHHYHHHGQLEGSIEQVIRTTSSAITDDSSIFEVDNNKKGSSNVEEGNTNNIKRASATTTIHVTKRRRSSNKDRHSKIRTAQGLRDRRMRLSLEVAHPFFKLQDMLGYDKASKTVEWLLIQSKQAIEEVSSRKKQASPSGVTKCTISSISDCEVESTTIDQQKKENNPKKTKRSVSSSTSASKSKVNRKRATKESRTEARARARERTRKRLIMSSIRQVNMDNDEHVGKFPLLGRSSSFEMMEIHHGDSNYNGIYQPSIENPDQVNGTLAGSWNSLFTTTFSYQPKW